MASVTVNNTEDSGPGSLRQAILDANRSGERSVIRFEIGSGVQRIIPKTPLPKLTGAVSIDGSTQPGYSNTPLVQIDFAGVALGVDQAESVIITALDLSHDGARATGTGLSVTGGSDVEIKLCKVSNRAQGIVVADTVDLQIHDNDLTASGVGRGQFAVSLSRIRSGPKRYPGGLYMRDNTFGESQGGLLLEGARDLTISDGSMASSQIVFEDGCGLAELGAESTVINIRNATNLVIDGLDLSGVGGIGLKIGDASNVKVQNCKLSRRKQAIVATNLRDLRILDNDLTSSGDPHSLLLRDVRGETLPGGLEIRGNRFSKCRGALYLRDARDLMVSDGSVAGSQIVFDPASDLASVTGDGHEVPGALHFHEVSNMRVAGLDLSYGGEKHTGTGLRIEGGSDNTIRGCRIAKRVWGIHATGANLRILDNELVGSGDGDRDAFALHIHGNSGIDPPGGLEIRGNTFGQGQGALLLEGARDLTISDGSIASSQIIFEDTCGLTELGGAGNVIELRNAKNVVIADLDLSFSGAEVSGTGLRVTGSLNVTARKLRVAKRTIGVIMTSIRDVRVLDCNFSGSGGNQDQYALYLDQITAGSIPGSVTIHGNIFTGCSQAVSLKNIEDLVF